MHRTDAADNVAGMFSDGSPPSTPATVIDAAWMNDTQENICQLIEAAGLALVKGTGTQLRDAVLALIKLPPTMNVVGSGGQPALGTQWAQPSDPSLRLAFYKDTLGNVVFEGSSVTTGATPAGVIFTLPVGFRPVDRNSPSASTRLFVCSMDHGGTKTPVHVQITTTGEVTVIPDATGAAWAAGQLVSFDNVRFRT